MALFYICTEVYLMFELHLSIGLFKICANFRQFLSHPPVVTDVELLGLRVKFRCATSCSTYLNV